MQPIGIYGGTFDPFHSGHLHLARTVLTQANLQYIKLIPCYQSPLRTLPLASAQDRIAMIRLALAEIGAVNLKVDTREADNPHPSYAVNTLRSLRAEMGGDVALCFIMAQDAFAKLTAWYDWQHIPELCHIIVTSRAGIDSSMQTQQLPDNLPAKIAPDSSLLATRPAGYVWFTDISPLNVSASTIRLMTKKGEDTSALLPRTVWKYIQQHNLYR